jgi:hypothetical protein
LSTKILSSKWGYVRDKASALGKKLALIAEDVTNKGG